MEAVMEYNLVFKGEVEEGHDISITKEKLASAFKISNEKVDTLFSGRSTVIKKGLTFESGVKLQKQLLSIGAKTDLELSDVKKVPISPKAPKRIPPVNQLIPAKKIDLVLQPLQSPAAEMDDESNNNDESEKSKFTFPQISFSLSRFVAVIFLLIGVACLIIYSPFTDQIVRKGFVLGGLLVFLGYRKLRQ